MRDRQETGGLFFYLTRKIMARTIKNCLALILVFGYSISYAGITGKIQGTITDQNGQPLPGSNVMVLGTNRGAAADENGFYIILNIAPGNYSLTSQMIGFRSKKKTSVIVNSDRTTQVNFSLYEEAIGMDEVQ
ncbi:MAG: carboxypeptidase-like regulatory domain-containing protein, partial [Candidatus Marinimicrobia bacterium]|nr:carboxypeptidase-like regulatory domain-containing protein [Candidatus Neomarinimicrobiota bacterium]